MLKKRLDAKLFAYKKRRHDIINVFLPPLERAVSQGEERYKPKAAEQIAKFNKDLLRIDGAIEALVRIIDDEEDN